MSPRKQVQQQKNRNTQPKKNTQTDIANTASNKATEKRNRIVLSSSSEHSSPESKQPNKMSITTDDSSNPLLETIKKMLNDNYSKLSSEINTASESIKADVGQRIDKLKAELRDDIEKIDKKVENLSGSVDVRMDLLSNEIKSCRNQVEGAEEDFLRAARMNELKLIGLNHRANENLEEIINKIADLLGVNFGGQTPTMVRATKWVKNEQIPQMIVIIKFLAPHLKESFYKKYMELLANKKQLTLDMLGMGSNKERLTIGENLTPQHQKIFAACMALKKDGKIAQVFTSNGLTHIKIKRGEHATALKTQRDLDLTLAERNIITSMKLKNSTDELMQVDNETNSNGTT